MCRRPAQAPRPPRARRSWNAPGCRWQVRGRPARLQPRAARARPGGWPAPARRWRSGAGPASLVQRAAGARGSRR
ncbi:MAG: hypothetical protein EPO12_08050 [Aquabacterium sp.]|nr:MAG: hypothetical protein EPO12_08050 [Aquabacterium sp.]